MTLATENVPRQCIQDDVTSTNKNDVTRTLHHADDDVTTVSKSSHDNHGDVIMNTDCNCNDHDDVTKENPSSHGDATVTPPTPPDGGYGWVVVGAVLVIYLGLGVNMSAFPVLYPHFIRVYNTTTAQAGWVGALNGATGAFFGTFTSAFIGLLGYRVMVLASLLLWSLGCATCSLSTSIALCYLTYGVISGLGTSATQLCSLVPVQEYFDKKRLLANGLATSGMLVGQIVGGPLAHVLVSEYGLHGALLLLGGIYLQTLVFGALLRPLKRHKATNHLIFRTATNIQMTGCQSEKQSLYEEKHQCDEMLPLRNTNGSIHEHNADELAVDVVDVGSSKNPCKRTSNERTNPQRLLCSRICRSAFDLSLFAIPEVSLFIVSGFLLNVGICGFASHMPSRALHYGISPARASLLPTVFGISSLGGRAISMVILGGPARKCIDTVLVYGVTIAAAGVVIVITGFTVSFVAMVTCMVIVSAFTGVYFGVQPSALVELVTVARAAQGLALTHVFIGLGILTAAPLAGVIYDVSGSYDWPFIVIGTIQSLGGVLSILSFLIRRRRVLLIAKHGR